MKNGSTVTVTSPNTNFVGHLKIQKVSNRAYWKAYYYQPSKASTRTSDYHAITIKPSVVSGKIPDNLSEAEILKADRKFRKNFEAVKVTIKRFLDRLGEHASEENLKSLKQEALNCVLKKKYGIESNFEIALEEVWDAFIKRVSRKKGWVIEKITTRQSAQTKNFMQTKNQWYYFVKWLKKQDESIQYLHEIQSENIREFKEHLKLKKFSRSTIHNYIVHIREIYRQIVAVLNPDVIMEMSFIERIEDSNYSPETVSHIPFTEEEIERLLKGCKTDQKYEVIEFIIKVGLNTGLRLKDIALLKKNSVNLETGMIQLVTFKNKHIAKIIIRDEYKADEFKLLPYLRELNSKLNSTSTPDNNSYFYPTLANLYLTRRERINFLFKDLMKISRVGVTIDRPAKSPISENHFHRRAILSIHSLRTFFISSAINKWGYSIEELQAFLGSSTVSVILNHYYNPQENLGTSSAHSRIMRVLNNLEILKKNPDICTKPYLSEHLKLIIEELAGKQQVLVQ